MLDSESKDYDEIATLLEASHDVLTSRTNEPLYVPWKSDVQKSAAELIRLYTATGETEKLKRIRKQMKDLLSDKDAQKIVNRVYL